MPARTALLRFRGGKKNSAQIQRMPLKICCRRFPEARACQEKSSGRYHYSNHPLIRE